MEAAGTAEYEKAWTTDVRIRVRPGRADSGVKLYVTDRDDAGAREFMANTGFLRYPVLFAELAELIADTPGDGPLRALVVPLSVGLEAASLAVACLRRRPSARTVRIDGFDISRKATDLARTGVYPRLFFPDDLAPLAGMVEEAGAGYVRLADAVRRHVDVLPASDVFAFAPARPYDLVVCLNLMMHLPQEARPRLTARLAALVAPGGVLVLNNNQEWPGELAPHYRALVGGGFVSLAGRFPAGTAPDGSSAPDHAVTDANALIMRKTS